MADYGSNSVPSSTHKTYKMYCPCQLKDNFNKETENFNSFGKGSNYTYIIKLLTWEIDSPHSVQTCT